MIAVLSNVPLASVQDLGRYGVLGQGVGPSGVMDDLAMRVGNLMLGNAEDLAVVEVQVFPFQVRFDQDCDFALTGADTQADLDGRKLPPWWRSSARAGQVLTLGLPASGARAYLAVSGGIDVPVVLGSRSTQLRGAFGGFQGRALRQGDVLPMVANTSATQIEFGVASPAQLLPLALDGLPACRVLRAAEYDEFLPECLAAFWAEPYKVTAQSNRYGYRLSGPSVMPHQPLEMQSHGITAGVVQVPHGGQPIIQMRDAQPMGGYPKLGCVIGADLWRLGQLPIGTRLRFIEVDYDQAIAALDTLEQYCASVRQAVELDALMRHDLGVTS